MNRTLRLTDLEPVVGRHEIDLIRRLAAHLQGRRVLHVNSTRTGGGVAEILTRLVPLMQDVGLTTEWRVIEGDEKFFDVTKSFHNALQGQPVDVRDSMFETWLATNLGNASVVRDDFDFVIIHDPQPAALIQTRRSGRWIWRCHIDISQPNFVVWNHLRAYVSRYDAAIFSMAEFAQPLPIREVLIRPSIDPLSEKNMYLPDDEVERVYRQFGIPRERPIILQVSRFDRFKDPVGVITAYRLVKRHHDCVLVLAGGTATDDPEGAQVLNEVRQAATGDPDIHVLLLPPADRIINALQRGATIILQKSLREGFGLTVTEALWKGKPVIGGNTGGIATQVQNGHTGYLVDSVEGAAYWTRYLLEHPHIRRRIGELGREHVRRHFLVSRNLKEYLTLFLVLESNARGLHYL